MKLRGGGYQITDGLKPALVESVLLLQVPEGSQARFRSKRVS